MEAWTFLISMLVTLCIGALSGLIYAQFIYKNLFGGIKIAMFVGMCGSVIGGFVFDLFFKLPFMKIFLEIPYFSALLVNKLDVNFIALLLGNWMFLSIYEFVSEHTERS
ncbi:MAG: hypothetical protein ACRCVW_01280 [Brevinema sp.]